MINEVAFFLKSKRFKGEYSSKETGEAHH